jgi:microcystin-dependent protein
LLGTSYGGDGMRTFGLPKLVPITPPGPNFYIAVSPTTFPFPPRT